MICTHQCSGNCRREGCNCLCGEYHCDPKEPCVNDGEECPNHPQEQGIILTEEQIKNGVTIHGQGGGGGNDQWQKINAEMINPKRP